MTSVQIARDQWMGIKMLICTSVVCICGLFLCISRVYATEYSYKINVTPLLQRFIAKPTFESIEAEFTVSNVGDPVYIEMKTSDNKAIRTSINQIAPTPLNDGYLKELSYLILPNETRRFRINMQKIGNEIQLKDYIIDLPIQVKAPHLMTNNKLPITIEPSIHAIFVLSISPDGKIPSNPKIALFRNASGYLILDSDEPNIVLTIQNRSEYMLPITGMLSITDPTGERERIPIIKTFIPANGQKNMLTDNGSIRDIAYTIDSHKLKGGRYYVSTELRIPGAENQSVFGNTTFYVIPRIYIVAFTALLLAMLSVILYIGSRNV